MMECIVETQDQPCENCLEEYGDVIKNKIKDNKQNMEKIANEIVYKKSRKKLCYQIMHQITNIN